MDHTSQAGSALRVLMLNAPMASRSWAESSKDHLAPGQKAVKIGRRIPGDEVSSFFSFSSPVSAAATVARAEGRAAPNSDHSMNDEASSPERDCKWQTDQGKV
eukprot:CAMPEP_0181022706 /NCGR_PEP_ID=MMETSP1070-20121207/1654_1 /TAXON_ID=265543 /ORGANISM="Minutocellus polymorphus, Strain NH13" /LENGTH=102 /DNA_ID=CAMNT_0023099659 /DNA_START=168 /DNA_END=476 /DNA_ORIENTATION=+